MKTFKVILQIMNIGFAIFIISLIFFEGGKNPFDPNYQLPESSGMFYTYATITFCIVLVLLIKSINERERGKKKRSDYSNLLES